jgi:hypothetical protein
MSLFGDLVNKILKEDSNSCNIKANQLKVGDKVRDINPACKEYKAKGRVRSIQKVKDGTERKAGNLVEIEIENKGKHYKPGEKIKKTEIQLKKI